MVYIHFHSIPMETICQKAMNNTLLNRFSSFKCINCLQFIDIQSEDYEFKEYTLCPTCNFKYEFKKCSVQNCNNNFIANGINDKCHIHTNVEFYDNTEMMKFLLDIVQFISNHVDKNNSNKKHNEFPTITKSLINKHNDNIIIDEDDKSYKISFNDVVNIPENNNDNIIDDDPKKYTCTGFTATKGNKPCTKKAKTFNKLGKPVCGFHCDK